MKGLGNLVLLNPDTVNGVEQATAANYHQYARGNECGERTRLTVYSSYGTKGHGEKCRKFGCHGEIQAVKVEE